jgi:hypothetical protein
MFTEGQLDVTKMFTAGNRTGDGPRWPCIGVRQGVRRVLKGLAGEGRRVLKASPDRSVWSVWSVPHLAVGREGGLSPPAKAPSNDLAVGRNGGFHHPAKAPRGVLRGPSSSEAQRARKFPECKARRFGPQAQGQARTRNARLKWFRGPVTRLTWLEGNFQDALA